MLQMKRVKKTKSTKVDKRKRIGMHSRTQFGGSTYLISIVTEKGEKLTYRVPRRSGTYKIAKKHNVPYTHIKVTSTLKVSSKILLYSQEGVVKGTVKRITASGPSTDVEPGGTPPIKKPGGH